LYINQIKDNVQFYCYWLYGVFGLSSSVIEWRIAIFSIESFFGISGTGLIFLKTLEAVISSGEVSEGRVVLKTYEGSAEIGNTFCN
jgi:uncharacterized alkaline shock family protein YloU